MDYTFNSDGVYEGPTILRGSLMLTGAQNVVSLGCLEEVFGLVLLDSSSITSLGNLRAVRGGYLQVSSTQLETLGPLENVDGGAVINNCPNLRSLGSLECVSGDLYMNDTPLEDLGVLVKSGPIHLYRYSHTTGLRRLKKEIHKLKTLKAEDIPKYLYDPLYAHQLFQSSMRR